MWRAFKFQQKSCQVSHLKACSTLGLTPILHFRRSTKLIQLDFVTQTVDTPNTACVTIFSAFLKAEPNESFETKLAKKAEFAGNTLSKQLLKSLSLQRHFLTWKSLTSLYNYMADSLVKSLYRLKYNQAGSRNSNERTVSIWDGEYWSANGNRRWHS